LIATETAVATPVDSTATTAVEPPPPLPPSGAEKALVAPSPRPLQANGRRFSVPNLDPVCQKEKKKTQQI
jgi:hypothetical protein